MSRSSSSSGVPAGPVFLGALGALPFGFLAAMVVLGPEPLQQISSKALGAYGAVILSFLGGIHWGLAMGRTAAFDQRNQVQQLFISVIPSLIGWMALLCSPKTGLLILAVAFIAVLAVDIHASKKGEAPAWYPQLRIPLTTVVVLCVLLGSLGL